MIHFTGIVIQRESINKYSQDACFPYVNRDYAIKPFPVSDFIGRSRVASLRQRLRQGPVVPLAAGEAIPLGRIDAALLRNCFSLFTAYQAFDRAYLPRYDLQSDMLSNTILECSKEYDIKNPDVLL